MYKLQFNLKLKKKPQKKKTSLEPGDNLQMEFKSIMRTGRSVSEYDGRSISFNFI